MIAYRTQPYISSVIRHAVEKLRTANKDTSEQDVTRAVAEAFSILEDTAEERDFSSKRVIGIVGLAALVRHACGSGQQIASAVVEAISSYLKSSNGLTLKGKTHHHTYRSSESGISISSAITRMR